MTVEAKKRTRRHLSEQAWVEVFDRFEGSGDSVTGFCKREGLDTSSFHRWRRRLLATAEASVAQESREAARDSAAPNFIEVGAMGAAGKPARRLEVRLELGDGLVLHLVRG